MTLFDRFTSSLPWLERNTILLAKHGSHAYGTNTPESDEDFKGVAIPPAEYFYGFSKTFEQAEGKDPDVVIYDIRKFFNLASDCNPSIIEMLWVDEFDVVKRNAIGRILVDNRCAFLSKRAKFTFSGYAIAQLKRIETHRRWLLNPPKGKPERTDFGLIESRPVPKEQLGAAEAAIRKELDLEKGIPDFELQAQAAKKLGYDDNFIDYIRREQDYRRAMHEWKQYNTWLETRNPKRAAIEKKHGYDCKHAMHLVRLMRMGDEIMSTGKVIVKRPDREELLAIRNGAWKYEDLMDWAMAMDKRLDYLYQTSNVLPHKPPIEKLQYLCCELVKWGLL